MEFNGRMHPSWHIVSWRENREEYLELLHQTRYHLEENKRSVRRKLKKCKIKRIKIKENERDKNKREENKTRE